MQMELQDYQKKSRLTAKYPDAGDTFQYPILGLVSEAGEIAGKLKKHIRDDGINKPSELSSEQKKELAKELGDVMWYVAQLATELGADLNEIGEMNIEKLYSRMDRGKLGGSGDNR
jgi:NTP pyrophosphatase (non-canonical NTP hydrolase)